MPSLKELQMSNRKYRALGRKYILSFAVDAERKKVYMCSELVADVGAMPMEKTRAFAAHFNEVYALHTTDESEARKILRKRFKDHEVLSWAM
jgi:hypothetical protein